MSDNKYHSPEVSEDDGDGDNKIVIRNLRWRSSTVSEFIENFMLKSAHLIFFFFNK
jgi:hypothetical protein